MSTKVTTPPQPVTNSRPELKTKISTEPNPLQIFTKKMEDVLVEKSKEGKGGDTLMQLVHGAESQLKKIRDAIQRNEPSDIVKHSIHLANYGFLITTRVK